MDQYDEFIPNLEWLEQRLAALDQIEERLLEMKALAVLARDHKLDEQQIAKLNKRIRSLQIEVNVIDNKTREHISLLV